MRMVWKSLNPGIDPSSSSPLAKSQVNTVRYEQARTTWRYLKAMLLRRHLRESSVIGLKSCYPTIPNEILYMIADHLDIEHQRALSI